MGDLASELAVLSRAQRWEEMPPRITDEVLHTYAAESLLEKVARLLQGSGPRGERDLG